MNYQAHKIIDHLYQGGVPPLGPALHKAGIDVLVLCANEWQDEDETAHPHLAIIRCGGEDSLQPQALRENLPAWKKAAREVVRHVIDGKNVLVTCMAGHNRSGIVVAMALAELTEMSGEEIVDLIQSRRPHALNNGLFVDYIIGNHP